MKMPRKERHSIHLEQNPFNFGSIIACRMRRGRVWDPVPVSCDWSRQVRCIREVRSHRATIHHLLRVGANRGRNLMD